MSSSTASRKSVLERVAASNDVDWRARNGQQVG